MRPSTNFAAKRLLYPRGALAVSGIGVIRLLDAGSEADADHGNGVKCTSCSERRISVSK